MHVQQLAEGLGLGQGFGPSRVRRRGDAGFVGTRLLAPIKTISPTPYPIPTTIKPYIMQPMPVPIDFRPKIEAPHRLTIEQLEVMRDRIAAREGELEARQYAEDGDGYDEDLEREANEANATDKAVAEGAGITVAPVKPGTTGALALAALAYFLFF